ncbi:MAG TPA: (2Fe-2S)-binding protein [Deltaproteobacteria bacterium]|nr:(2Fe-2S)-binding protein [Deltaproteobacteria bacterium]
MTEVTINGEPHTVDVDADAPLLWVLREELGLQGTKFGCGLGQCGACTVHVDGAPTRSCVMPIAAVAGRDVQTIDALGSSERPHPIQQAWIDHQVPQCGYCQSGMQMAVAALLRDNPSPTDADIDAAITNICRCGCYDRIRAAIHDAARAMPVPAPEAAPTSLLEATPAAAPKVGGTP